jgi:hypothetical protein
MTAVVLRLRAELRLRARAWLTLAVVLGVAAGAVVALAAASQRTRTAYGRYQRAVDAADAYANTGYAYTGDAGGEAAFGVDRFAGLPQIARSERTLILALIARTRSGDPVFPAPPTHIEFQVTADDRIANTIDTPLLLDGRLPDPRRVDEALGDRKALQILGIRLGDTLVLRTVRQSALDQVDLAIDPRSARAAGWGDLARVRVVGVQAHAKLADDGGFVELTPAFRRAHGGAAALGHWATELAVRLRHRAADVGPFHRAVDAAAGSRPHGFYDPATTRPVVQRSIDLVARALQLLTIAAAIAALVLGGQAVLRSASYDARTTPTLQALGMSTGQLTALGAARGLLLGGPAVVLTVATALLLSPLAPVGWARELDPDRGMQLDATAVVIGGAAVLAALVAIEAFAARRAARAGPARIDRVAAGHGRLAAVLARSSMPTPAATGVRMALGRRTPTTPVPARATLASAVAAVVIAVLALTFAQSAAHLLHTPRLYGQTWDYETYDGEPTPKLDRAARRDPAVEDLARGATSPLHIGALAVGARATRDVKGRLDPTVLEGRAPRTAGETLVGTKTLHTLHRDIGDRVAVQAGGPAVPLTIVGRGVLSADKWTAVGQGLWMTLGAFRRIQPHWPAGAVLIRLRPRADRAAALRRLDRIYGGSVAIRPQEISDLARVHGAPALIGLAFAIAAAAALAHLLVTSVRRRRRDLAILKTLGFTRGQVHAAVAWQATTVAAVGALVGVPLGVALGRFGWNLYADDLGVASEPVTPVGIAILVVPAAILLANLVAILPARRAAVTRPAIVLRAE